jgi:predicted Ser/Thr protein kinase
MHAGDDEAIGSGLATETGPGSASRLTGVDDPFGFAGVPPGGGGCGPVHPGTRIGSATLIRLIAEGGMGRVYEARQDAPDRMVAVKVLHPHLSGRAESRKRLEREARAVARLHHPNILEVFDFSAEAATEAYLVTEYIRGQTLRQFINDESLQPPEVAAMAVHELASALAHAHDAGILHRDLKPENVMVRDDEPVVIDFDPFFTRRVDERSTERSRAAARGFVPVAMMLLSCSMESRGLALFDPRDIARAARDTGRGPRDVVDRLAVACDRVVECCPDRGAALMGVMQKYVPFWIAKGPLTDAERSALRRVSRMADDWCALRRIEIKGLYGAHVRAFLGLAMRAERGPFWAAFAKLEEVAMYTGTDEAHETDETNGTDETEETNGTDEAGGADEAVVCCSPF